MWAKIQWHKTTPHWQKKLKMIVIRSLFSRTCHVIFNLSDDAIESQIILKKILTEITKGFKKKRQVLNPVTLGCCLCDSLRVWSSCFPACNTQLVLCLSEKLMVFYTGDNKLDLKLWHQSHDLPGWFSELENRWLHRWKIQNNNFCQGAQTFCLSWIRTVAKSWPVCGFRMCFYRAKLKTSAVCQHLGYELQSLPKTVYYKYSHAQVLVQFTALKSKIPGKTIMGGEALPNSSSSSHPCFSCDISYRLR